MPAYHIGFLDFNLSGLTPEFFATYRMKNLKNHEIYSDKFTLSAVNLNCIELATAEDKQYSIDYWASLFKAATWEEKFSARICARIFLRKTRRIENAGKK